MKTLCVSVVLFLRGDANKVSTTASVYVKGFSTSISSKIQKKSWIAQNSVKTKELHAALMSVRHAEQIHGAHRKPTLRAGVVLSHWPYRRHLRRAVMMRRKAPVAAAAAAVAVRRSTH